MARPTDFTQETADTICQRIASGESLRGVCRSDDMPDASTVFRWLASNAEAYAGFREQYARARDIQADALVDEILEISDDGSNDWMERHNSEGESAGWQLNGEHVQRSRLRVDSRKWFASKVAPKKYGERVQQEITGPNGGPVETKATLDVASLTNEQLRALASIRVNAG
jgi:hypothetical protein